VSAGLLEAAVGAGLLAAGYGIRWLVDWLREPPADLVAVEVAFQRCERISVANEIDDQYHLDETYALYPDTGLRLAEALIAAAAARGMSQAQLLAYIASAKEKK
jgi:hypothetical protein